MEEQTKKKAKKVIGRINDLTDEWSIILSFMDQTEYYHQTLTLSKQIHKLVTQSQCLRALTYVLDGAYAGPIIKNSDQKYYRSGWPLLFLNPEKLKFHTELMENVLIHGEYKVEEYGYYGCDQWNKFCSDLFKNKLTNLKRLHISNSDRVGWLGSLISLEYMSIHKSTFQYSTWIGKDQMPRTVQPLETQVLDIDYDSFDIGFVNTPKIKVMKQVNIRWQGTGKQEKEIKNGSAEFPDACNFFKWVESLIKNDTLDMRIDAGFTIYCEDWILIHKYWIDSETLKDIPKNLLEMLVARKNLTVFNKHKIGSELELINQKMDKLEKRRSGLETLNKS